MKSEKLRDYTLDLIQMDRYASLASCDTESRIDFDEHKPYRFEKINNGEEIVSAINAAIKTALEPFRKRVEDAIREEVNAQP